MGEPKWIEVGRQESPFTQAWMCESCGNFEGRYGLNQSGSSFLLPLSNCCATCGTGPQSFELVSGRWTTVHEVCSRGLLRPLASRHRHVAFKRTGLPQQMTDFTENFVLRENS